MTLPRAEAPIARRSVAVVTSGPACPSDAMTEIHPFPPVPPNSSYPQRRDTRATAQGWICRVARASDPGLHVEAESVLARHGYATTNLGFVGAGAQSACYGTREIAILLSRADVGENVADLTGHTLPRGDDVPHCATTIPRSNGSPPRRLVRTYGRRGSWPLGEDPRQYAVIQRAHGTPAAAHRRVSENAALWFGQLGAEIRKTHLVETKGFGMFVPDGAGGFRGRFATWTDYLNCWLGVHLCVGQSRPEDEKVLTLLLAQGIVTEHDLAAVAAKVREAQEWPVRSVLTHYDNRLDNLVVDADRITVLDWGTVPCWHRDRSRS